MIPQTRYSAEVDKLVSVLSQKPEGVPLTNKEITDLIGYKSQESIGYGIGSKAISKLMEKKIHAKRIRRVGIVVVSPVDAVYSGKDKAYRTIERGYKKGLKSVRSIDIPSLPQDDQVIAMTQAMTYNIVANAISKTNQTVLEDEVKSAGFKEIDVMSTTLRMLSYKRPA